MTHTQLTKRFQTVNYANCEVGGRNDYRNDYNTDSDGEGGKRQRGIPRAGERRGDSEKAESHIDSYAQFPSPADSSLYKASSL